MRLVLTNDAERFFRTENYEIQQTEDAKWKLRKQGKAELEISYSSISNELCFASNFFDDYMIWMLAIFPTDMILWHCVYIRAWKEEEEIKIDIIEQ